MSKLNELSIVEASKKLAAGESLRFNSLKHVLQEIEKRNPSLNVFLEIFPDALEQAKKADERRKAGETHALLGIPLAIKDNILIEGRNASAASKILENYVATYDATAIKKLKEVGAVFSRTNMDEFAFGWFNRKFCVWSN